MDVFIADIDVAKLYVQFFGPSAQYEVKLKCWFLWMRLWVVANESLKTKKKSSCVIQNVFEVAYGSGFLRKSFSLQKFNSQFKLPACRCLLLPLLHAEKVQQRK